MELTIAAVVFAFIVYIYFKRLEAAYCEINKNKIKRAAEDGNEKAFFIYQKIDRIDVYKAGIKFVINLLVVFLTMLVFILFWQIKNGGESLEIYFAADTYIWLFIISAVISEAMLLFGSLLAENFGSKRSEDIVCSSISFVSAVSFILCPVIYLSLWISKRVSNLLGIVPENNDDSVTEEEIRLLVDASEGDGAIDQSEKDMINNIFEFNNTIVGNIATHRTDIVAVPISASLDEVIEVISGEKFSRIPVYDENIEDIIGIFRVRDLLKFYIDGNNGQNFQLNDIIIEPYFVPFSKKTDELFEDMQKNKVQMAVVIDEYGGTAGIVTMEDLIEEIMGNIFDEYDEEEEEIYQIDENTFLIQGTTEIEDVADALGIELENSEDYDTIGGYLIGKLERIPDDNERPKIEVGQCVFKIEKIFDKRIELIKVHKNAVNNS